MMQTSPDTLSTSVPMSDLAYFTVSCLVFSVEDKVKDQLEAANPEPVIEEVVNIIIFIGLGSLCYDRKVNMKVFLSVPRTWPTSHQGNLTGRSLGSDVSLLLLQ